MRILSLDIGSYSVKATEFDVTFGRVELADYLIEKVVESELEEVQATQAETTTPAEGQIPNAAPKRQVLTAGQLAAIRRLISDRPFRYERLVVNFPKAWTTTRLFQFPSKDKKAIQSSLQFELDDEIPFSINEIIYDFAILNQEGAGSSVFAAVALKSDITSLLSELQVLGLDPDSITIEPWGFSHTLKRAIPKEYEGRPVCVVNMGHKQTSIHMYVGDEPVLTHVSLCAGADITRAIAQAYNLTFDQAEKAKVDGAFLLTQTHLSGGGTGEAITEEQRQFSSVISGAIAPMIREIKQTLMSYKSQTKLTPRAIFITGGTSLVPNMQLYLEEQLKIPVFNFAYMSRVVGQTLQLSETSEAQISAATGLSLTVVKADRNRNINFRKELFAKQGGLGAFDFQAFRRPLKYVAASLAFVYLNLIVQGMILSSRSKNQEALLERAVKSVVGAVSPTVMNTYINSPSTLKTAVNKELSKYKTSQVVTTKPQVSAYELLNKISAAIPKDMVLDVNVFEVKGGKLRMTGVVDNSLAPDRIAKAIADTKVANDVTKGKVEEDPKTRKVKFEITGKVAEADNVKTR